MKANQPISEVDEEWLDSTGNLVDEGCVVNKLVKASDYESALKKSDLWDQSIVQMLTELAASGEKGVAPSKKHQCMIFKNFHVQDSRYTESIAGPTQPASMPTDK